MECLPKTISLSLKRCQRGKRMKLLHWRKTTIKKKQKPLDTINKVTSFYFPELKEKCRILPKYNDMYNSSANAVLLPVTLTGSMSIPFNIMSFLFVASVMAVLLVLGRHEHHDLKANLSYEVWSQKRELRWSCLHSQ